MLRHCGFRCGSKVYALFREASFSGYSRLGNLWSKKIAGAVKAVLKIVDSNQKINFKVLKTPE